jgi:hypothetical protein
MLDVLNTALPVVPLVVAMTAIIAVRGGPTLHKHINEYRHQRALRKLQQKLILRASDPQNFHAVTIVPARPSCKLVRRHCNTRYLTKEAPRLPLSGCRLEECRCRYMHHDDRRIEDRRNLFGIDHVPMGIGINRREQDRRQRARTHRTPIIAV